MPKSKSKKKRAFNLNHTNPPRKPNISIPSLPPDAIHSIIDLPYELLINILIRADLPTRDLWRLRRLNRAFSQVVLDADFWGKLVIGEGGPHSRRQVGLDGADCVLRHVGEYIKEIAVIGMGKEEDVLQAVFQNARNVERLFISNCDTAHTNDLFHTDNAPDSAYGPSPTDIYGWSETTLPSSWSSNAMENLSQWKNGQKIPVLDMTTCGAPAGGWLEDIPRDTSWNHVRQNSWMKGKHMEKDDASWGILEPNSIQSADTWSKVPSSPPKSKHSTQKNAKRSNGGQKSSIQKGKRSTRPNVEKKDSWAANWNPTWGDSIFEFSKVSQALPSDDNLGHYKSVQSPTTPSSTTKTTFTDQKHARQPTTQSHHRIPHLKELCIESCHLSLESFQQLLAWAPNLVHLHLRHIWMDWYQDRLLNIRLAHLRVLHITNQRDPVSIPKLVLLSLIRGSPNLLALIGADVAIFQKEHVLATFRHCKQLQLYSVFCMILDVAVPDKTFLDLDWGTRSLKACHIYSGLNVNLGGGRFERRFPKVAAYDYFSDFYDHAIRTCQEHHIDIHGLGKLKYSLNDDIRDRTLGSFPASTTELSKSPFIKVAPDEPESELEQDSDHMWHSDESEDEFSDYTGW